VNPTELEVNRRTTRAFIAADPVSLALVPYAQHRTASGGLKQVAGTPRSAQQFRLIPLQDVMPQIQTPDGVQLTPQFVLMGAWNCEVERWDRFSLNGNDYVVVSPPRPEHTVESRYYTKVDVARA
jgi:hypothetical protein